MPSSAAGQYYGWNEDTVGFSLLHLCSFFHGGADNILKMDAFLLLDMTDIDIRHLPRDTGVATPLKMITTVHKLGWKNKSSLSIFVKVKIKTAISLLD